MKPISHYRQIHEILTKENNMSGTYHDKFNYNPIDQLSYVKPVSRENRYNLQMDTPVRSTIYIPVKKTDFVNDRSPPDYEYIINLTSCLYINLLLEIRFFSKRRFYMF